MYAQQTSNKTTVNSNLPKLLYTMEEVCEILGVSRHSLRRMMTNPNNPLRSIGSHKGRKFSMREIERWIAAEEAASVNGGNYD